LNTIPVRERPKTTRPERFTHGMPKIWDARQSGCHAVIASTISSYCFRPGLGRSVTWRS
jgi:hypothetical protein